MNKKVTVKVDMGRSKDIFQYDPYQRKFTMKDQTGERRKQEVFYI